MSRGPKQNNRRTGDRGESIALKHLEGLGMELVERNHRTRYGEIDLIVHDADILVFVEVKYRRGTVFGSPLEAVTPKKQAQVRAVAEAYLAELSERGEEIPDVRFDVVGILESGGRRIEHVAGAF